MSFNGSVDSLVNSCMYLIVKHFSKYGGKIEVIPNNLKDRMLNLMSKRGLLCDENILTCLYASLRELDLSECEVSDSSLQDISSICKSLCKIDLNSAKGNRDNITSEGVSGLSEGCKDLQVVYLRRCVNVSDKAITALTENCPRLKELNISGCLKITDRSLVALGEKCANLVSVNLAYTAVTDNGVLHLCTGLPRETLTELHINNCENLTDQVIEHVTQSCPFIKVLLLHGCPNMTDAARQTIGELTGRMRHVTWTFY